MTETPGPAAPLRVGVVPGVSPGRWADTWRARRYSPALLLLPVPAADAEGALLDHALDAAFLRLPLRSPALRRIPLWTEETVVAMSREHELTLLDVVTPEDLAGETMVTPADDVLGWTDAPGTAFPGRAPATTEDALALVAHEAGVCVLPRAVARGLHRRDVELRPLVDSPGAPVPVSQVGLAWLPGDDGEASHAVDRLIGVVRGRTERSTRGPQVEVEGAAEEPTREARATRGERTSRPRRAPMARRRRPR